MKYAHLHRRQLAGKNFSKGFSRLSSAIHLGKPDYFLVAVIFIIIIFGLVMLSSATSVESFRDHGGNIYYFFWRQVFRGFLPGLALFLWLARTDYKVWERYSVHFFILSLAILILVFIPGLGANYSTAKSWITLFGYSFQPAEAVKLFLLLSLAGWFSYRGREMNRDFWNGLMPFAFVLGMISLLIMLQPDLGTLMVIVTIALSVYYIAGAKLLHIIILSLVGAGGLGLMILQAPYRAARLMTFLHPELDPQGIGYHINQAFLAIGSGGFFGLGYGQSRQKFAYLPEVMGDSIFAVITEELGFIFAAALIVCFLLIAWRGCRIILATKDDYARYVVSGIIAWLIFQAFYNIGAMIGLLPLTGIPLPFISYGGTALMSVMAASGILVNISSQTDLK